MRRFCYGILTLFALLSALSGNAESAVFLPLEPVTESAYSRPINIELSLLTEFSTYYGDSTANRKHNVELAVSAIDGITVKSNETLSFNAVVGARTAERGYKEARVIKSGEYVEGIGGGVCQVSSTLYNSWVLSGLTASEVQCHTLPSHYVGISRDAAVSEYKDLKLLNDSASDVFISAIANGEDIIISVYGASSDIKYSILTEIVSEIEPKEIETVEIVSDVEKVTYEIKYGKNGYHTRAFLIKTTKDGSMTKTQIRDDWYSPIKHKIIKYIPKSPR